MAGSVNKVILIGNLGKDPEIRHFEGGGVIANFPVATTESYRDRTTGEKITLPTDWHNVVIKRAGLAKVAEQYLKKGQQVYIEGKLRTRTYEKDGDTKYITEVVVDELTMLGGAKSEGGSDTTVRQSPAQEAPQQATLPPIEEHAPKDDDLPF